MTVVAKGTFSLPAQGTATLLASPLPIYGTEQASRSSAISSVRRTSDWVPSRPRADVTLFGSAHAPTPVRQTVVRLSLLVDERLLLNKSLVVAGEREEGGAPEAFTAMPIVYERAAGGTGSDNPVGLDVEMDDEPPNVAYQSPTTYPAGFGPLGGAWPSRSRLLGAMERARLNDAVADFPDDFDWTYFQAAPADQQTPYLRGDETIVLDGLHPEASHVEVRLPSARAVAAVFGLRAADGRDRHVLEMVADTLHLEPDEGTLYVVWRGAIGIPDEAALERLVIAAGVATEGHPAVLPESPPADAVPIDLPSAADGDGSSTVSLNPNATILGANVSPGGTHAPFAVQRAGGAPMSKGLSWDEVKASTASPAMMGASSRSTLPVSTGLPAAAPPISVSAIIPSRPHAAPPPAEAPPRTVPAGGARPPPVPEAPAKPAERVIAAENRGSEPGAALAPAVAAKPSRRRRKPADKKKPDKAAARLPVRRDLNDDLYS